MAKQLFFLKVNIVVANLVPLFVQGAIVYIMVGASIVEIVENSVTSV
jgi:hypothetical protein